MQTSYQPQHKPNQIIIGTGNVAIVTGWTPKEAIANRLALSEYAAIGQLYSPTRGINFLIRNLLANPQIRHLVILDATKEDKNAGACQCLADFFLYGFSEGISDTGKECWVINSDITGYIDTEIPGFMLSKLRFYVTAHVAESVKIAKSLIKLLANNQDAPWGCPTEFPIVETKPKVLPGHRYGHRIEGKTIAETWVKIIHRIKTTGTIRPTGHDSDWQELIDLMAVVTDEPPNFYYPDYLVVNEEFIEKYIPHMLEDNTSEVKYTYGQRLRSHFGVDQIEQVIEKLVRKPDAASGVMSLWDVKDHFGDGSPCLNHIWVRIVGGELSLTATFRSNDMFSAWAANAMQLRALQVHILSEVVQRSGITFRLGPLITISQSAHIYDDCWESTDQVIANHYQSILKNEQRRFDDPVGNFLIETTEDKIIVVQRTTTGSGEVVSTYTGSNPLKLGREICADSPGISPEHALYLGLELEKAALALNQNTTYFQDRK